MEPPPPGHLLTEGRRPAPSFPTPDPSTWARNDRAGGEDAARSRPEDRRRLQRLAPRLRHYSLIKLWVWTRAFEPTGSRARQLGVPVHPSQRRRSQRRRRCIECHAALAWPGAAPRAWGTPTACRRSSRASGRIGERGSSATDAATRGSMTTPREGRDALPSGRGTCHRTLRMKRSSSRSSPWRVEREHELEDEDPFCHDWATSPSRDRRDPGDGSHRLHRRATGARAPGSGEYRGPRDGQDRVAGARRARPGADSILVADAHDLDDLRRAMEGCSTVYFLIHSLLLGPQNFESAASSGYWELQEGRQRRGSAGSTHLGALGDVRTPLSPHLRSRVRVAQAAPGGKHPNHGTPSRPSSSAPAVPR